MNFLQKLGDMLARQSLRQRRSDFYYDLASSLEDRMPLFTTLRKYEARARRRDPMAAPMYMGMLRKARTGSLAEALQGIVPAADLIIIDSIQAAGDSAMASGLYFLSETVEKIDALAVAVKKAIIYPSLLLILFSAMLAGFSFFIIPVLESLLPAEQWPLIGRIVYVMADIVRNFGLWFVAAFIVVLTLFIWSLSRWQSPARRRVDRYLPYRLYRDYSGAMALIAISSLMRSGVSLRSSVERCFKYSSLWLRWHLREVMRQLSSSDASHFGRAFSTGFLSQVLEDRVQDASERRDPVTAFVRIGVGSVDRIIKTIEETATQLNTVMIVICGVILGLMMTGFFSTAMSLHLGIQQVSM